MSKLQQILDIILNRKNSYSENEKLKKEISILREKNKNLEKEKNELEKKIVFIQKFEKIKNDENKDSEKFVNLKSQIQDMKDRNINLESENEKLKLEKETIEKNVTKYIEVNNYLKKYEILIEKLEKSVSLNELNRKIESANEIMKFLKFIEIFGNGEDFLIYIYKEFKEKKITDKIPLTTEEIELIDYINEFFREKYNYNHDVLMKVNVNQDKFDKSIMQDILKPSDFNFKIVEEFYVPGIKTKSYNFKSIVKGRK